MEEASRFLLQSAEEITAPRPTGLSGSEGVLAAAGGAKIQVLIRSFLRPPLPRVHMLPGV